MKPGYYLLLVSGMLTITITSSYSQAVFGLSSHKLKDTLLKYGYTFPVSKISNNGVPYDSFIAPDGIIKNCYYNKNGFCYDFMEIMGKIKLINQVEILNKNFIKTDSMNWISKNTNVKVRLYISDEDWFYVEYEYIGLKDM